MRSFSRPPTFLLEKAMCNSLLAIGGRLQQSLLID